MLRMWHQPLPSRPVLRLLPFSPWPEQHQPVSSFSHVHDLHVVRFRYHAPSWPVHQPLPSWRPGHQPASSFSHVHVLHVVRFKYHAPSLPKHRPPPSSLGRQLLPSWRPGHQPASSFTHVDAPSWRERQPSSSRPEPQPPLSPSTQPTI